MKYVQIVSSCMLIATIASADVIVCDCYGTDGTWPNTPTTMSISLQSVLAEACGGVGASSSYVGGGRYNLYCDGVLEGYVIDLESAETMASGGGQPAASPSIVANRTIRRSVMTQARPRAQAVVPDPDDSPTTGLALGQIPGLGRLSIGTADVFYNRWEVGEIEGSTFGVNPSVTYGQRDLLTLGVPLHVISLWRPANDEIGFLENRVTLPFASIRL